MTRFRKQHSFAFFVAIFVVASANQLIFEDHAFAQSNSLESELDGSAETSITTDEQKFLDEEYKPPKEAPYTEETATSSATPSASPSTSTTSSDVTPEARTPFEQSGLRKVTAKGEYVYNTPETPINWAFRFKIRPFSPANLSNKLSNGTEIYFTDLYGKSSKLMFDFDIEYLLLSAIGKLYVFAGTGLFSAEGHGRFKRDSAIVAREKYSLYMAPNRVGGRYAFDYSSKQFFIPYGFGGSYYFAFLEDRDDGAPRKYGGTLAPFAGGGLAFRLDALAKNNAMDAEYGINHVHFFAEAEQILAGGSRFDFSGQYYSGGVLFEF